MKKLTLRFSQKYSSNIEDPKFVGQMCKMYQITNDGGLMCVSQIVFIVQILRAKISNSLPLSLS